MVGGGVRGKDDGIAHIIITRVGVIMVAFHPFMEEFLQGGEKIIEIIVGKEENGIINDYLIHNFNRSIKGTLVRLSQNLK
jgi:hypothetical protein